MEELSFGKKMRPWNNWRVCGLQRRKIEKWEGLLAFISCVLIIVVLSKFLRIFVWFRTPKNLEYSNSNTLEKPDFFVHSKSSIQKTRLFYIQKRDFWIFVFLYIRESRFLIIRIRRKSLNACSRHTIHKHYNWSFEHNYSAYGRMTLENCQKSKAEIVMSSSDYFPSD